MPFTYPPFYDVQTPVGNGAPNQDPDVMLVQYFLFSIYIDEGWPLPFGPEPPDDVSDAGAIQPIDGVASPDLGKWISAFQAFANDNGLGTLQVDGIVSHGGAAWGHVKPRAANWSAIHAMNHVLFLSNKERFWSLPSDPSVPAPLQEEMAFVVNIDPVP